MAVKISKLENEYRLYSELLLPQSRDDLFPFFADAKNLEKLTPPNLNFRILTPQPIDMSPETVIDYRIGIHGLPIRWKTLISIWTPPFEFVDEQIKGPYRYWIHRHSFEEMDNGTLVKDFVRYQVFGGQITHNLFVKPDLIKIFEFRRSKLLELFGNG